MKKLTAVIVHIFFITTACLPFLESGTTSGKGSQAPTAQPAARQCNFNQQEAAFMEILMADGRQRRPALYCHPSILKAARQKARDMAVRDYFGHTSPDGIGPNYLVRQTGYRLPASWGQNRDANNIESISAGRATARQTYDSWLTSPGHRRHILGEIDFYASQTVVAIGYHYEPNSRYKHYWVFLSVPPEQ